MSELYKREIHMSNKSMISGNIQRVMDWEEVAQIAPVMAAWLEDDELQEITVVSTNLGFVKTFRKVYAS